jgi:hypothetical protein
VSRSCGTCTSCCEGWVYGSACGHEFWRGRPCQFVKKGVGCSIYNDRPQNPCREFNCNWLLDENIPDWMQPNQSGVILQWRTIDDKNYLEMNEACDKVSVDVLSWVIQYAIKNKLNLQYQLNGVFNRIDFNELMK